MNPRSHSRRPGVTRLGTIVLVAITGCGGLASNRETGEPEASDDAREEPSNEAPEEAQEQMPRLFDVLELRQLSVTAVPDGSLLGCDYLTRIKVNMLTGHLITATCDPTGSRASTGGGGMLGPAQLAAVEEAYRQVRSSSADNCSSGASFLTLALEIDHETSRERLLFADDDHAGCPLTGVTTTSFVSGLFELSAKLERLQER